MSTNLLSGPREADIPHPLADQAQTPARAITNRLVVRDTLAPAAREQAPNPDNKVSFWDRPFYAKVAISIGAVIISPFYLGKKILQAVPDACRFLENNIVKPVLNKVGETLKWVYTKLAEPALKAFYVNVLKPAYDVAKVVFKEVVEKIEKGLKFLFKKALVPALKFAFITVPENLSKYVFKPLHKYILKPAYQVVKTVWNKIKPALTVLKDKSIQAMTFVWSKAIFPVLKFTLYTIPKNILKLTETVLQKVLIDFPVMVLKNLHKHILAPAWKLTSYLASNAEKAISFAWNKALHPYVVKPLSDAVVKGMDILTRNVLKPAFENIVKPAFEFTFVTAPTFVYENIYQPVENMVSSGYNAIKDSIVELYRNFSSR